MHTTETNLKVTFGPGKPCPVSPIGPCGPGGPTSPWTNTMRNIVSNHLPLISFILRGF